MLRTFSVIMLVILPASSGALDPEDAERIASERRERRWQDLQPVLEGTSFDLFGRNAFCFRFAAAYVVQRVPHERVGRVVEVLRGPPREVVRLPPFARRLEAERIVVYTDEEGEPAPEFLGAPPRVADGHCWSHAAINPYTRFVRALGEVHSEPRSTRQLSGLLTSSDPLDVHAGCYLAGGSHLFRVGFDDWDDLGALLAETLAPESPLRQLLERSIEPDGETRPLDLDGAPSTCLGTLLSTLGKALRRLEEEPEWRLDALRLLVDGATHDSSHVRNVSCRSLRLLGFRLSCSPLTGDRFQAYRPDPDRLLAVRVQLEMPPVPPGP